MVIFHSNTGFPTSKLITGSLKKAAKLYNFADLIELGLLANLDFSSPVVQSFPNTAAGLANALGDAACTPSYIWTCQETSGNLVDSIEGEELVEGASPYRQTAVGIDDGSGYIGRKAQGFAEGTNQAFVTADNTLLDVGTDNSIAVVLVLRMSGAPTANRQIIHKRTAAGWYLRGQTAGTINAFLFDGSSSPGGNSGTDFSDSAWRYCAFIINRTTDVATICDSENTSDIDISGLGSLTNTATFGLGKTAFLACGMQVAYMAAFKGAAAEALTKAKLDNWWKHASDPTGLLTTQTRASLISVPVADGYVGHFAPNTLPIGYHSAFTDTDKLGLFCNSAVTNLIEYSEVLSNWTGSTTTKTDNAGDAPDGFRSATQLTATANDGTALNAATATAEVEYTYSVWVKRAQGTDVDGRLRMYDGTGAAQIGSDVAYTATDTWQRVSMTGTTPVDCTELRTYVRIDTGAESIYAWGAQVNLGNAPGAYIRTNGAAAALANPSYLVSEVVPMAQARVEADFVSSIFSNNAGNHCVWAASATGGTPGWRIAYIDSANHLFQLRDEDGNIWTSGQDGSPELDTLYQCVMRWDVDAGDFPENAALTQSFHVDGVKIGADETDTTTVTDALTTLYVGCGIIGGLDGFIQSLKVYDRPGEEPTA